MTVVADNFELAKTTVRHMAEQAQEERAGGRHRAMVLIGDLGEDARVPGDAGVPDWHRRPGGVVDAEAKLEGYSNAEIAKKCDCSVSTVERSLRGIRKIWGSTAQ
jgi:ABC-type hemin transport system substrate-binding protein